MTVPFPIVPTLAAEKQRLAIVVEANRIADKLTALRDHGLVSASVWWLLDHCVDRGEMPTSLEFTPAWKYWDVEESQWVEVGGAVSPWFSTISGCLPEQLVNWTTRNGKSVSHGHCERFANYCQLTDKGFRFPNGHHVTYQGGRARWTVDACYFGTGIENLASLADALRCEFADWMFRSGKYDRSGFDFTGGFMGVDPCVSSAANWFQYVAFLADAEIVPTGYVGRFRFGVVKAHKEWLWKFSEQPPGEWHLHNSGQHGLPEQYDNGRPWFGCVFYDFLRASILACGWIADTLIQQGALLASEPPIESKTRTVAVHGKPTAGSAADKNSDGRSSETVDPAVQDLQTGGTTKKISDKRHKISTGALKLFEEWLGQWIATKERPDRLTYFRDRLTKLLRGKSKIWHGQIRTKHKNLTFEQLTDKRARALNQQLKRKVNRAYVEMREEETQRQIAAHLSGTSGGTIPEGC